MADRRDFLKTMAIGGASALVAPSLLSSCSSDKSADTVLDTSQLEDLSSLRTTDSASQEHSLTRSHTTSRTRTGARRNGTRTSLT